VGICRKPWNYAWSSAAAHINAGSTSELLDLPRWYAVMDARQWKRLLMQRLPDKEVQELRRGIVRGWPLGSDNFLSKLEKAVGRRLRPLPVGRPKKKNENKRGK